MTAETALMLPLLVALAAGLVWLLAVGLAQVRVTDAAREAARATARGDTWPQAQELALRVAPAGASVERSTESGAVVVRVEADAGGPGGLLGRLVPDVRVGATAVAAAEEP
ncbi:hypothetical protein GCM10022215_27980 [Nocardioides fonticola]|uniref:TadE-like domain-containing protein n=1 Tax=Nocardioides fonticola TaxID=450363 RepID=A0ABP7XMZ0_9ACTN